uniref:Uncharacterized protein n=1 Tax=Cajanus cajan TaxID=3821 RepID=A0A151SW50_CAJCA|nr:hypothetical protein KK1_014447 [Cajanus cajan]KYP59026.1 hypothetical protein KK1_014451 [Cajanus cajan]
MALSHPYTISDVAQSYMDNAFKLHDFLSTITSDRDSIFVSQFWQDFMSFHVLARLHYCVVCKDPSQCV